MVSAPHADRVWKNMTRSITAGSDGGEYPSQAGAAAYAALLQSGDTSADGRSDARPWLLLRAHTAARSQQPTP
ncbi:hypothetical protein [Streptomyces canus]|uniref:hypothetical protein n=1 Tax=Streptomyces canus TaxID=58343 RepID=UPI003CF3A67A